MSLYSQNNSKFSMVGSQVFALAVGLPAIAGIAYLFGAVDEVLPTSWQMHPEQPAISAPAPDK